MRLSTRAERVRWVVHCDPLTVQAVKSLAAMRRQSIGYTLDQAVEYFSRKVDFPIEGKMYWEPPEDM